MQIRPASSPKPSLAQHLDISKASLPRFTLSLLTLPFTTGLLNPPASAQSSSSGVFRGTARPNIVLIFADDMGWRDPGYVGSDYCETPNIDRLASEGMVFRQAYAPAGNCQPSRACMLSGQYTSRHEVYAVGSTKLGPVELMRTEPVPNKQNLPLTAVTMGEAMQRAGYATGMFGKRHLQLSPAGKTENAGFDDVAMSRVEFDSKDPEDPKGIYTLTKNACEFIEASQRGPFFVYLSHFAPHWRQQGRPETVRRFESKPPGPLGDYHPLYGACVADLDNSIGMVLAKLKELGLEKNTLVLFTSDNGGVALSQEPLRGKKGCYYEGGIRVPMVVRWPGVVAPGSTCDAPVINIDFYPTFLAAAGIEPPAGHVLDGASLVPLFRGRPALDRPAILWHFPGYLHTAVPRGRDTVFRTRPVSVIRKGDWKLLLYHEEWMLDGGKGALSRNRAVELYNLVSDPGERDDVSLAHAAKRDELLDDLLAWIASTSAKLPTKPNPLSDG